MPNYNLLFFFKKRNNRPHLSDSDETETVLPSLPVYPVSSTRYGSVDGLSTSPISVDDNKSVGPTGMRFVVIGIMSAAFFLQVNKYTPRKPHHTETENTKILNAIKIKQRCLRLRYNIVLLLLLSSL